MLYMQEVEKMEGYGQETFQAKVGLWKPLDPLTSMTLAYKILLWSYQDNTGADVTLGSCLDGIFVKHKSERPLVLYRWA